MASRLLSRSKILTVARLRHPPAGTDPIPPSISASASASRALNSFVSHPLPDSPSSSSATRSTTRIGFSTSAPAAAGLPLFRHLDSEKIGSSVTTLWYRPFCSRSVPHSSVVGNECGSVTSQADKIHSQIHLSGKKAMLNRADGSKEPTSLSRKEGEGSTTTVFSPLEGSLVRERKSGLSTESSKVKLMELSTQVTYWLIPALLLISKSTWSTSLLVLSIYWQIYGFFKEILLDYVHHEVTRKWVLVYFKLLLLILAKETILDFNMLQ